MKRFLSRLSILAIMTSLIVISGPTTVFAAHTIDVMVDDGEAITVAAGNKVIAVDDALANCDTPVSVTLTEGTYTPTELAVHAAAQMTLSLTADTVAGTYNYETRKFTFTGAADGDSICWAEATTTAETILGFAAVNDTDIDTVPAVSDTALTIGDRAYLTSTVGSNSIIMDIQIDVAGAGDSVNRVTIVPPTGYNITGWNLFNDDDGDDAADAIDTPNMDNNAGNTAGCGDINRAAGPTGGLADCAADTEITGNGSNSLVLDLQTVVASGQILVVQLYVDAATTAAQSSNWTVTTRDNNGTPATASETFQVVTADAGDVVFEVYPAGDALDGDVSVGLTNSVYIYDPDGTNFVIGASAWATTKKTLVSGMALYQDGTEFTSPTGIDGTFDYAVTGADERLVASDATYDWDGINIIKAARAADTTDPDISAMTVNVSSNQNIATFTLTEPLINDTLTIDANHSIASTASIGDLTSAGAGLVFAGLGTWTDTDGQPNTTTTTGCNTVTIDDTLTSITVTATGTNVDCYFTNTATSVAADATSDNFTPAGTFIADAAANTTDTTAIGTGAITVTSGWDVTAPSTPLGFQKNGAASSTSDYFGWQAVTDSTFGTYVVLRATSSGITAGSGATTWGGASDDTTLTTVTTASTTVTGLTNNTIYYYRLGAVDPAGNIALSSEINSAAGSGGGGSVDSTPAAVPTELAATTDGSKVTLSWTDPTNADFNEVEVYKSNSGTSYFLLKTVAKTVQTLDDSNVTLGNTYFYNVKSVDTTGNRSDASTAVSIKVEAPETIAPVTVDLTGTQSGTATLTENADGITVEVVVNDPDTDTTGTTQQAHIHSGTCAETGDIAYVLTDLVDGAATTILDGVTLAELEAEGASCMKIHDATDPTVIVASGVVYPAEEPTPEEVAAPEVTVEGVTPDETGTVVEEITVKGANETAYATISAGTTLTIGDAPATSFMPPTVKPEVEVTPPEGAEVASDVYSIGSGEEGVTITASQPVTVYLPVKEGFVIDIMANEYQAFKLGSDESSGTATVVTSDGATLFRVELTSFSDYVILAFAAPEEEEEEVVVEEEEEEEEVAEAPFTDTTSHWSKDYVADLYAKGIVSGKTTTKYAPDDAVTRAEFTKIIVGAFGIDLVSTTGSFTDISGHWGSKYIEAAKAAGVISGYSDKTFKPDAKIKRAEALKILLEAADVSLTAAAADFPDVKASDWFAKYVNYAAANEIVKGYDDGTFGPDKSITRGEVAKIVSLMIAE